VHLADVGTGAEDRARPGEDDRTHLVPLAQPLDRLTELGDDGGCHRVASARAVEPNQTDLGGLDHDLIHGG
jgi:hypothetical protein